VAIIGAAGFGSIDQAQVDQAMELFITFGVNHIDVAPSYGHAEDRMGPWVKRLRDSFFLGCKTMERTKAGALEELQASLKRLNTDHFDLYQIHAITSFEELDKATGPGSTLEALVEAREKGLTRFLGITGHGVNSPAIFIEALRRFDFDSVLFPINFVQYANPEYRRNTEELLRICKARDVGTMIIKSICERPWGEGQEHIYHTWYRPFDDLENIQKSINFVLSQDVTSICTAGETKVLPLILEACEKFTPMTPAEQEALIATAVEFEPLFA
jgi:aryl-alcohol dehydrogenase-like predicted oxidoreductase